MSKHKLVLRKLFLKCAISPPPTHTRTGYYFAENRQNLRHNCRNMNLPSSWHFYKCAIFFKNAVISAKFTPNCRNMNFSWGWYFCKCAIILYKYSVISSKIDEFVKLIVKIWTFIGADTINEDFFCVNALLFYWRSVKFAIFCL